ncbi:hypothetical protein L2K20_06045 [Mycobacterium sp. MBM]|nr:hypothetical protein [Mycobacterium sp. MBM]
MSQNGLCSAGYQWCQATSMGCADDHSSMTYQRSTLGEGAEYRVHDDSRSLLIGTGVRFNAHDGDIAPRITVHIEGGPDDLDVQVDLRVTEAYGFSRLLDAALMDATSATLGLLPPRLAADLLDLDGAEVSR